MQDIKALFVTAINTGQTELVGRYLALFPKLGFEAPAEYHIYEQAKLANIPYVTWLKSLGQWSIDFNKEPWYSLNKKPYYPVKFALSSTEKTNFTDDQLATMVLDKGAYDWLSMALYLVSGFPVNIANEQLCFLLDSKEEFHKVTAKLRIYGIPFKYTGKSDGLEVVQVPPHAFDRIYQVMALPLSLPQQHADASRLPLEARLTYEATFFDTCFLSNVELENLKARCQYYEEDLAGESEQDHIYICLQDWVEVAISRMNRNVSEPIVLDKTKTAVFDKLSAQLGVPFIKADTNLCDLTKQQKSKLYQVCLRPEHFFGLSQKLGFSTLMGQEYIDYTHQVLSTFLPDKLQRKPKATEKYFTPQFNLQTKSSLRATVEPEIATTLNRAQKSRSHL